MNKTTRRLAIAAGILFTFLLAGYLTLQHFTSPEEFKPRLARLAHKLTGLEAHFNGQASLEVLPLGLRFEDVSLSMPDGPAGPDDKPLLHVDVLEVKASLMELVQGVISASAITVQGLQCNVLRDAEGRLNIPAPPVKEVQAQEEHVKVVTRDNETLLFSYSVRDLTLSDASFVFEDKVLGARYEILDLQLKAADITPDAAFPVTLACNTRATHPEVQGQVEMQADVTANPVTRLVAVAGYEMRVEAAGPDLPLEKAVFELSGDASLDGLQQRFLLEKLKAMLTGAGGDLPEKQQLTLQCPRLLLDLGKGELQMEPATLKGAGLEASLRASGRNVTTAPVVEAQLQAKEFSPRQVMQSLGLQPPATPDPKALDSAALELVLGNKGAVVEVRSLKLELDAAELALSGQWDPAGRAGDFSMQCNDLNIDRYLPFKDAGKEKKDKKEKRDTKESKKDKPATEKQPPLPEQLRDVQLRCDLHLRRFTAGGLTAEDVQGTASLIKGRAQSSLTLKPFYGGTMTADASAELATPSPPLALEAKASGLSLGPLLQDATGKAPLSGTAALHAKLASSGLDVSEILPGLRGDVNVKAVNGAIHGFSLSAESLQKGASGGSTAYQELSASGPVKDGVLHLRRIRAQASPNSASGSGTVDLVRERLNLRLQAKVLQLAGVPVHIHGSWNDPSVSVDAGSVARSGLEALGTLLEAPEKAGESVGEGVGELLDGFFQ